MKSPPALKEISQEKLIGFVAPAGDRHFPRSLTIAHSEATTAEMDALAVPLRAIADVDAECLRPPPDDGVREGFDLGVARQIAEEKGL